MSAQFGFTYQWKDQLIHIGWSGLLNLNRWCVLESLLIFFNLKLPPPNVQPSFESVLEWEKLIDQNLTKCLSKCDHHEWKTQLPLKYLQDISASNERMSLQFRFGKKIKTLNLIDLPLKIGINLLQFILENLTGKNFYSINSPQELLNSIVRVLTEQSDQVHKTSLQSFQDWCIQCDGSRPIPIPRC